jgi:hypothetical protein
MKALYLEDALRVFPVSFYFLITGKQYDAQLIDMTDIKSDRSFFGGSNYSRLKGKN